MSPKKRSSVKLGSFDPSSFSNPDKIRVVEMSLFWDICFKDHVITGKVHLKCKKIINPNRAPCNCDDGHDYLILDTRDIKVEKVINLDNNEELHYKMGEPYFTFGSYLSITLPPRSEGDQQQMYNIAIEYGTASDASALQWLTPQQTLGKVEPFMFSQCQSIHCRSIIPCQDTPAVKCPYKAEVTAPKQLMVLMSAIQTEEPEPVENDRLLWKFAQNIPIPSYLVAIVAGRLKGKLLGLKSKVYAEPEIIQECVFEFSETDKMLKSAIQICGEYVWGRYDLLVLPPSFPYGGMENPCLTFVTPTLLAGDRSLANVIAHEISHSWTGNLVTNKTFEHFWLNEGFTTFIERKIQGLMHGEAHRHFHAFLGLSTLKDTIIKTLGEDNPFTCLVPKLTKVDPDDAFSAVPYEKGHTLLFHLEQVIQDQKLFDDFLKSYLKKFKFLSITTDDFKNYVYEFFKEKRDDLDKIDWNTWFYKPGMPPVIPDYDRTLIDDVDALAQKWIDWKPGEDCLFGESPFNISDLENFTSAQKCLLLTKLWESDPLDVPKLKLMENAYKLRDVKNSEIRFRWLRLCIKGRWEDKIADALKFVNEQGRMKFVRPIYRELFVWSEARAVASQNFLDHKKNMMYVCATQVEKDLGFNLM